MSDGAKAAEFAYASSELEAVAQAGNYYDWIWSHFGPHVGRRVIEVGAGIGTVSELILRRANPDELVLVEPAVNNVPLLRQRFEHEPRVRVYRAYLEELTGEIRGDTLIAVNVLEHVKKDLDFLRAARSVLAPSGSLLLLVPALPALYGTLDEAFEHVRRYTRTVLQTRLRDAGFEVATLRYLNSLGVLAWFLSGRVMRRKTISLPQVRLYDRLVIPWLSRLERVWTPPFGQSLLAIAHKRST